ncbi:MAG: PAS domain S-box protein [Chloroflexi bacterium]|nr:PAS domain S-box protein [Chloroflexota bacterium]
MNPGRRRITLVPIRHQPTPGLAYRLAIGLLALAAALSAKAVLVTLFGQDTSYLTVFAALPIAALMGGLPATVVLVVGGAVLDVVFLQHPTGTLAIADPAVATRSILFLPIGLGLGWLIGNVGASRREAVRAARRTEAVMDALPDVALLVDRSTDRIEYANRSVTTAGWEPEELTGRDITAVIPEIASVRDPSARLAGVSVGIRSPAGDERPVDISVSLVGSLSEPERVLIVARDATDRIEAEVRSLHLARLERAHGELLEGVFAAMDDGVALIDRSDAIVVANRAMVDITQRPIPTGEALIEALGHGLTDGDTRLSDPEGWVELRAHTIGDQGSSTLLVARDVTKERQATAARDAFIGVLSHELRTPVTTILGFAQLLSRPGRSIASPNEHELAADLVAEATRLGQLIEDLVILSRSEDGRVTPELEPVLMHRLIPETVAAEAQRYPHVQFEMRLPRTLPAVDGDTTYLEQVLRNIIGNAGKYTPAGGVVQVTASVVDGLVSVSVLDSGPGFESEDEPHLFDIFFRSARTSRQHSGSGIGLYVARTLVEAMGGSIWARLRPEGGAEFSFSMPMLPEELDDLSS